MRNFFWWVERRSRGWVEKHVAAFVNISGTVLGVPKVPLLLPLQSACGLTSSKTIAAVKRIGSATAHWPQSVLGPRR